MRKIICLSIFLVFAAAFQAAAWNGESGWHGTRWHESSAEESAIAYGVRWDQANDTYTEGIIDSGTFIGQDVTTFPVQEQMRRCVLQDSGTVNYYLGASDSTKKANGDAATLDGTDGQVMVEIPDFYYVQAQYSDYRYFFVADGPFTLTLPDSSEVEASLHPAFTKAGASVDYRYVGAYQANIYDDSASGYVGGDVGWDTANDQMASVSGVLPAVDFDRGDGRTLAENRGSGWHQLDANLWAAVNLLYVTEYADLNAQDKIGAGITDYAAWPGGPQALGGNSNGIGNATGNDTWAVNKWSAETAYSLGDECIPDASQTGYTYRVTSAGTTGATEPTWPTTLGNTVVDGAVTWECVRTTQYMSYRGIENWYGHIWQFIDAANIHNSAANGSRLYTCGNYENYADDTDTNYTLAGSLAESDGYITDVVDAVGFWPVSTGGGSATYLCDYYYTFYDSDADSGWRVAPFGGYVYYGAPAGPFCVYSSIGSSFSISHFGGRLCF
ncbi:MAG: hypothetical protein U5L07_07700 [Desulfobacterales bacterium]|nr:hypothetical protein [Desulfobacterales bacterium]